MVISCEHGGNRVPQPWAAHFHDATEILATHRGYDPGTLRLGRQLARAAGAPLVASTVSRLLVDLNRSIGHRRLFSTWSMRASDVDRRVILRRWYVPHRAGVQRLVADGVASGEFVLHVSVHSFTPTWDGIDRGVDIGWLYDPRREAEREFCAGWQQRLRSREALLRCRKNQPYRGVADGLTTHLRRRFPGDAYAGIELEVSQGITLGPPRPWARVRKHLIESFLDQRDAWTARDTSL